MQPFGIYIHIPFCVKKCAYCAFYSEPDSGQVEAYISALKREMEEKHNDWSGRACASVFIGGGTPSVLHASVIPSLLGCLRQHYALTDGCEISCEANPDTFSEAHAKAWKAAGVNRLSFGVQSSNDRILRSLGRPHSFDDALRAIDAAKAAGFNNLNADIMFGLPGQTDANWESTLHAVAGLGLQHVSCYGLQLEEGTPLYHSVQAKELALPSNDETGNLYDMAKRILPGYGYARYEISNYAKPGFECRHNMNYWRNGDYLNLGASAHGAQRKDGVMHRLYNPADIGAYLQADFVHCENERIDIETDRFESIMLATRMVKGLDIRSFDAQYGESFESLYQEPIQYCVENGLAEIKDAHFRLSERGLDLQNSVLMAFMPEE